MEGQKLRRRTRRPKTRTGCYNCKARHIKCDEDRPICRHCLRSGRTCGGYPVSKEQVIALRHKQTSLQPKPLTLKTNLSPGIAPGLSSPEREALEFFRHEVVCNLPGSASYPAFQRSLVDFTMSACFTEPAVAHISAALGSACRSQHFVCHSALLEDEEAFMARQRVKALSALQRYIKSIPTEYTDTQAEVVLVISLLFFCFELWRCQDQAALVHLRSGLNILYEKCRHRSAPNHCGEKRLVRMEVRPRSNLSLLLQVFVKIDSDVLISKGQPHLWATVKEPLPVSFTSMDEATVHLDALAASIWATVDDLVSLGSAEIVMHMADLTPEPGTEMCLADAVSRTVSLASRPDLEERMEEISRSLQCWLQASSHILHQSNQEHSHILAQLHFFTLWFEVLSWRQKDETYTDGLQDQFSRTVDLCERYIDLHRTQNSLRATNSNPQLSAGLVPLFSLGTNLVICACTIAFKSRSSSLRRRCVKLLADMGLQGVFDNFYLISLVQAVIDLEEERAMSVISAQKGEHLFDVQIPPEARLLEIDIDRLAMTTTPEFYKADYSHFVYAVHGHDGKVKVRRQPFVIQRPASVGDTKSRFGKMVALRMLT